MKVVKKMVRTYVCDKCKTHHSSKRDCVKCEKMPVEATVAHIGDQVKILEPRTCQHHDKPYFAEGIIVEISDPIPYDEEYEAKWLQGTHRVHRRLYLVDYTCPRCKEERGLKVFAPEFTILKTAAKQTTNGRGGAT